MTFRLHLKEGRVGEKESAFEMLFLLSSSLKSPLTSARLLKAWNLQFSHPKSKKPGGGEGEGERGRRKSALLSSPSRAGGTQSLQYAFFETGKVNKKVRNWSFDHLPLVAVVVINIRVCHNSLQNFCVKFVFFSFFFTPRLLSQIPNK